jgi:Leucine-rich repeat (LRR) protein
MLIIIVKYENGGPDFKFKSFEEIINREKVLCFYCFHNNLEVLPDLSALTSLKILNCSYNKLEVLLDLLTLTFLQVLDCSYNKLEVLPDLSALTSLQNLDCYDNNLEVLPDLSTLTFLQVLNCFYNKLKVLSELSSLTSLQRLDCSGNKIEFLPNLSELTSLRYLNCSYNNLTSLPDLSDLTSLQSLNCSYNNLESLPDLSRLTSFKNIYCFHNKLTSLPDLSRLTSLQHLNCYSNKLKSLPISLLQCRNLECIIYSNNEIENIPPILTRFLDRLKDTRGRDLKVYSDTQSVHNAAIQDCVRKSILNILEKERGSKGLDQILEEIISDETLTQNTKESLFEYCRNSEIHSTLNISFSDFLIPVWTRIQSHTESLEMKKIMNIEMTDALCKCFTGRLSRLLNVLNGYYEDIKIEISENDQIANIIYLTRELLKDKYDLEAHKELVRKEMLERKYNSETIDIWVDAIE